MLRFWVGFILTIAALGLIAFNTIQATNEAFFPLIFMRSMIPTETPTQTATPSPSPTPTATLAASPTPTATSTATQMAQAKVVIVEDAAPLKTGLEGEFVQLENQGTAAINLQNWALSDEEDNLYTFPSFTLGAGSSVKIWTKSGTNSATELYWGNSEEVWNNDTDVVTLEDQDENEIDAFAY